MNKKALRIQPGFIISVIIILFLSTVVFGDSIELSNGQKASTKIIDTNGCSVTIQRNGQPVSIKKNLVRRIVWGSDTISYDGYACQEKPKPGTRFEDTPEYKLMALLDNAPELSQVLRKNMRIAFLISPLQGNFNAGEFIGVQSPLMELAKTHFAAVLVKPQDLLFEIESGQHRYDYAFVFRKYHVEIAVPPENTLSAMAKMSALGKDSQSEVKKILITIADVMLYDFRQKEIVFHQVTSEKRNVRGESEYTWSGMLIPDEWEKEWQDRQTERKLDRNAQAIRRSLEKEFEIAVEAAE